jgi:hypothetical protein
MKLNLELTWLAAFIIGLGCYQQPDLVVQATRVGALSEQLEEDEVSKWINIIQYVTVCKRQARFYLLNHFLKQ